MYASAAVLLVLLAGVNSAAVQKTQRNSQWTSFKIIYGKYYEVGEEPRRRAIWEQNIDFIETHNVQADRGEHTYWLGENRYADMTGEEFVEMFNGFTQHTTNTSSPRVFQAQGADLPDMVDWRQKGFVTPIKDQKQCGSCWAFSATGSLEGQHFKKTGQLISLSEQNLIDCSKKQGNFGCGGGLMDNAFEYIKVNHGIDTEASYPYRAVDGKTCRFTKEDVGATLSSYVDVRSGDEKALQEAVASIGPISVAIDASHPSFQLYKRGVYVEPKCSTTRLDHGVLAVGYGSENGQDYWLVKNSWGVSWGMSGYINMRRNHSNMCGIATSASYPVV